jgi:DNA-binding XRE family transcriptional regulator
MTKKEHQDPVEAGARSYQQWRDKQMADPEFRAIYEEEAAKSELWLQLAEARQKAGLTQQQMAQRLGVSQAQVARIEKRGYDAYTLTTLRRYITALGEGFSLEVKIHIPEDKAGAPTEDRSLPHQFA